MSPVRAPYRYGAAFHDPTTGLRFEGHHPAERPDLWQAYLDGTVSEYERYGLGHLVDRHDLARAEGVSLFFVGFDARDDVMAGLRCHGPLDALDASQALAEMASSPGASRLRAEVEPVIRHGVVEIKGAWRHASGDGNHLVGQALTRCCVHALEWLAAELALAAVADRMELLLAGGGAQCMSPEPAVYPTERYRTILMSWRRSRYGGDVRADQAPLVRREAEQLHRPPPGVITGWRPVLLDVSRRTDRQVLVNLRRDPAIDVVDLVPRQRDELTRLLPPPGPEALSEPPRWVYYPWRRTVVRMLGPKGFPLVRLDRNRHRITRHEQQRLSRQRVGVVGLSAGHSVATALALEGGCGELRLADFDAMELTNLNRLPGAVLDIGVNKSVLAARRVAEVDPYLPVTVFPEGLTEDNVEQFVAGLDVVVEECDDLGMKVKVREVARRHGVAVVMETSDRGLVDVERFDDEPQRPLFHGLLPGVTAADVASLTVLDKVPHVLRLVDAERASARGAASLAEIGRTLSTWPQLASDVLQGGATAASAVRRIGLGEPVPSGRARVDVETVLGTLRSPSAPPADGADGSLAQPVEPHLPPWAHDDDPVVALARAAARAPSGGNAQPWQLELSTDGLRLELDRSRTSTMDVRFRGSYVGLGAAVFNARVAASASGRLGRSQLFPDPGAPDRVCQLWLGDDGDDELAGLEPWLVGRCTNRRRGTPEVLELDVVAQLDRAVAAEGGTLHLVTDRDRIGECADLLGRSERVRFLAPVLHREMVGELRWPGQDSTTGIDVRTLELSSAELATLSVARRQDVMALLEHWDLGEALGDHARSAVSSASALAVVTVPTASPAWYVRGGSAVERLWLCAQRAGLSVQPVSPVFVFAVQSSDFDQLGGERWAAHLRELAAGFRDVVGIGSGEAMALVLRLHHARPPSARSERLPLQRVARFG